MGFRKFNRVFEKKLCVWTQTFSVFIIFIDPAKSGVFWALIFSLTLLQILQKVWAPVLVDCHDNHHRIPDCGQV